MSARKMLLKIYYDTESIKKGQRIILGMYGIGDAEPDQTVIAKGTPAFSYTGPLTYPIYDNSDPSNPIVREAKDELEIIQYGYKGIPDDKFISNEGKLELKSSVPVDPNIIAKVWNDDKKCWIESEDSILEYTIVNEVKDLNKKIMVLERSILSLPEAECIYTKELNDLNERITFLAKRYRELKTK